MLAFSWNQGGVPADSPSDIARRLSGSLCSGIGGTAAAVDLGGLCFAWRPLKGTPAQAKAWRPEQLADGRAVAFHGYFDNAAEMAVELGAPGAGNARLYALALERWGDEADLRVIGEYCAIVADPRDGGVRLTRSPLRAPPLCYHHRSGLSVAASVPRALFAAGVPQRLNERHAADSALLNFTDEEASWFEDVFRVPLGAHVWLRPDGSRRAVRYYDLLAMPDVRLGSDAEYIERASALLDAGIRACLAGSRTPGSTLSSGLDSSQVVARALRQLPPGQSLPTFTFHPEAGWDGIVESTMNGNERPMVEAFAAMHPGVEPHFTANEGYEHDHRWNDLFHLMGGAPSGLCNMYVFHGLFDGARRRGCDLLLLAEWGNYTFSDKGDWGYVEYLLKGRWRQLWLALKKRPHDRRSMARKFLAHCLMPLLPKPLWRLAMKAWHRDYETWVDLMTPLTPAYREATGADRRFAESGLEIDRYQPWNRRHAQRLLFQNNESESAEIMQAFEQLYGVPQRDPTAYRPLVEFCLGLPVEMFLRDGEPRWLAKQMARGVMPDDQRANLLNGRWDSDWHLRIARRRDDYLRELDGIAEDPRLSGVIDVPRLRAALDQLPEHTTLDEKLMMPAEFAVPRGLLTARFVRYVEGRNSA